MQKEKDWKCTHLWNKYERMGSNETWKGKNPWIFCEQKKNISSGIETDIGLKQNTAATRVITRDVFRGGGVGSTSLPPEKI